MHYCEFTVIKYANIHYLYNSELNLLLNKCQIKINDYKNIGIVFALSTVLYRKIRTNGQPIPGPEPGHRLVNFIHIIKPPKMVKTLLKPDISTI